MNGDFGFEVRKFEFNKDIDQVLKQSNISNDLWPIVYILSDGNVKEAYIGETTDTYSRLKSHKENTAKNYLTVVHLITSNKFNKSATLDIESNLIKYISGDGQYKLLNGNVGLTNHKYYQQKEYGEVFKLVWDKLHGEGITLHSLDFIDNSDLFKYSLYKSLSKDQLNGLIEIMKGLLNGENKNIIVEGGAGTGKTVLAVFLFKLINSKNEDINFKEFGEDESEFLVLVRRLRNEYAQKEIALVVPMSSFRNTLKKVFKNIKGLNANMVIGPAEIAKDDYGLVLVDESHRLRRRINLGAYFGAFDTVCKNLGFDKLNCSELDWILKKSERSILFYDENQSIKPSDARKEEFDKLNSNNSNIIKLKSQFRVQGGNNYVQYIDNLLKCSLTKEQSLFKLKNYEFFLFDSVEEMKEKIVEKNEKHSLSRLIAGYSWPWISKNNLNLFDIKIGASELQWNRVSNDWVNSDNSINEVGCIHTTQGYDLNYAGIIFGNEISYDKTKNEIVIKKENYYDLNGKQSITDPLELKNFIINIYKTIMLRAIKGTYVYACDPHLKEYFEKHIEKYNSPKIVQFKPRISLDHFENSVKLFDLTAAAGEFSDLQNVSEFEWIGLPPEKTATKDMFACKVVGESMNKVIPNGSICLFEKDLGGSRNGRIVLVECSAIQDPDFVSGYTVKEYHSKKVLGEDKWEHESITLRPKSNDSKYVDRVLNEDELNVLKVVGIFKGILVERFL